MPGVVECLYLGGGLGGIALTEEDVVGGVGVEGGIEVDEVDGLIGDVVTEDGEVVSEVEFVGVPVLWGVVMGLRYFAFG